MDGGAGRRQRIWRTKDGRDIPIEHMDADHMRNAQASITPWSKGERDQDKKRELRDWRRTFGRELRRRERDVDRGNRATSDTRAQPKPQRHPSPAELARRETLKGKQRERRRLLAQARKEARKAARKAAHDKDTGRERSSKSESRIPAGHWSTVLGLLPDAPADEIERAFRDLAKLAHPDSGGSAAAMRQLISAREAALRARAAVWDEPARA